MRRTFLAALLAALILPAGASAKVPAEWFGVVGDGPLAQRGSGLGGEWDLMRQSGVNVVRVAVYWSDLQPTEGVAPDFSQLDEIVTEATSRGLRVVPVVHRAPDWARETPGDIASPPRNNYEYARFLTSLVARYGPRGTFWTPGRTPVVPIRQWQIWNEPNLTRYWNKAPYAPSYVRLLKVAARAVRAADPKAKVVLAGLPNYSWEALKELYNAGARGHFDIVALHPYTGARGGVVKIVRLARLELKRRRDSRIPVWLTEVSFPASEGKVSGGTAGFDTTEEGMASDLRSTYRQLAKKRKAYRIERVFWYSWITTDEGSPNSFDYSGLRRNRASGIVSVPALSAFQQIIRELRR